MARPKRKYRFIVIERKDRPNYYLKYYSEKKGKDVQSPSDYPRNEYTREQVVRLVNAVTGTKQTAKYSIDWLEQYNDHYLEINNRTDSTREGYKDAFRALRAVYGGDYSINIIKRTVIRDIKSHCFKNDNSPETINTYLRRLSAACDRVYVEEIIPRNPFYKFEKLDVPVDKQKHLPLAEAQRYLRILDKHRNEKFKRLSRIAMHVPLRRGQLLNLNRSWINMNERFFWCIDNKSRYKKKDMFVIHDEVVADFEYFLNKYPGEYPFKVYKPNSFTCMTKKLLKKHGFDSDLHLHSLRHTGITNALENGQPLREVQHGAGHKNQKTTEIYGHDMKPTALNIDYGDWRNEV
jgi:integrase